MGRLQGKTAFVTGAARGTGEATARLFVGEGARVVLADVLDERGRALASELGAGAAFEHLDVGAEEDWERAVTSAVARFGGIDVLVNNAAVLHLASLEDTGRADFERLVRVNQLGPFLGMRSVVPVMREAGGGSIVNIASVDGLQGKNGVAAYASTKWAVRGLTKVAAAELGKWGIRVNAVCPETGGGDMIAPYLPEGLDPAVIQGRGQPFLRYQRERTQPERIRDVALMVLFLASDESRSCTGGDFPVESGNASLRRARGAPGE